MRGQFIATNRDRIVISSDKHGVNFISQQWHRLNSNTPQRDNSAYMLFVTNIYD
jgi:hypothetical protein